VTTGLFLTPGAARTAYEAGAVHALITEGGIQFDVIGTCSAGAINGSFVATGQVDELVEQWSSWSDRDILGVDFAGLFRGAVLWAPSLMHNRPQRQGIIDRFIAGKPIAEGVRFRTNLANLTTGRSDVLEWPGSPVPLAEGVDAAVAVPALVRPKKIGGMQYADGLTIDGCPLEEVLLCTGVERAFVVGVAPQARRTDEPSAPLAVALAAAEWNQYTETTRALAEAARTNARAERWRHAHANARDAALASTDAGERRDALLEAVDAAFERHNRGRRGPVEIVPILPDHHTKMFFGSFRPERSRALIEDGRRDARAVLARLGRA
jgi:predicted acylesterase/phospholipase RssA